MNKDIQVRGGRSGKDTFGMLSDMDRMVDRVFSDAFAPFFAPLFERSSFAMQPRSEIRETNQAYVLSADIPGIPKDKVQIDLDGDVLSISASADDRESREGETRRSFHSFQQRFTLPSNVDVEHIEAHCQDGLLEVMIPKKTPSAAKKIEVQTGKGSFWSRLTGKEETTDKKSVN